MKNILPLLLLLILAACTPAPANPAWRMDDLRALDPADSPSPATDLTAVYLRERGGNLQIRLDLLDLDFSSRFEYLLYLQDDDSFKASPLVIRIPWDGVAEVLDTGTCTAKIIPRAARDFGLDTVTISLRRSDFGPNPRLDVVASTPGNASSDDELRGLALDAKPPRQTVTVLLAFYNTFNGATPALALRSWDGAHTGPRGERHGLRYLLGAAEANNYRFLLLDLNRPDNLSALDAMSVLPQLERMGESQTIDYPQETLDPATIFPTPTLPDYEPTMEGPSLALRAALLAAAMSEGDEMFTLGGDLQQSTWASPDYVYPTMVWLAARPYIQPISRGELESLFGQKFSGEVIWPDMPGQPLDMLVSDLETLLAQPVPNQRYAVLQKIYRDSLIAPVERAAVWAKEPIEILECTDEVCLWANQTYFAVFKLAGARLEFLFYHEGKNVHQIIGPTAQFIVGLSDPSVWDLSLGELADLRQVMGAFTDQDGLSYTLYAPRLVENGIAFVSTDNQRVKIFEFTENGLKVTYQGSGTVTSIPLVLDPWRRYAPGWASAYSLDGNRWGLEKGPRVSVQADGPGTPTITLDSSLDTLEWLSLPENPDQEFAPGHNFPFPVAIANLSFTGEVVIHLRIESQQ